MTPPAEQQLIPNLELKPCPFCGANLAKLRDEGGEWYGHPGWPVADCFEALAQIFDEKDAALWNRRVG